MSKLTFGLENKVVLVTGGSRGIGLEIARALLEEKAKVVICGRKQEGLDAAVKELQGGERLEAVKAHIGKEEQVDALFEAVTTRFSRLDILVNNVGMNLLTPQVAETEPDLWKKIIDSNLNGTFLCSRKAAAIMKVIGRGKIVNISSIAARRVTPGMGIYGVAKAGIEMMGRALAAELATFNIQVNTVAPSMVKTDFSKPFWSDEELHARLVQRIPLGRIADPRDVVPLVLFLASAASDYITGQTILVDGGSSIV